MSKTGITNQNILDGTVTGDDISSTSTVTVTNLTASTMTMGTSRLITTKSQLSAANYNQVIGNPATTYIWNFSGTAGGTQTDVVSGITLTVASGALTNTSDALNVTSCVGFDGSTYLTSSNALLAHGSYNFCFGGWFYMSNWAVAGDQTLLSRYSTNGWKLLYSSGTVKFQAYSGGILTGELVVDVSHLNTAWHSIIVSCRVSTIKQIYIDGVPVGYLDSDTPITDAGAFEVGANNGGLQKFTGSIDEVFYQNNNFLYDAYAASLYGLTSYGVLMGQRPGYDNSSGNTFVGDGLVVKKAPVINDVDETKFSHKMPIRIHGSTYYVMLTDS